MKAMTLRCCFLLSIALAFGALVPCTHAEVAVYELAPNNDGDGRPITIVRSIIDDGDPFVWNSVVLPTPGVHVLNAQGGALGDGRPSILQLPGDAPTVIWERGGDLLLSRFVDGAWSDPSTIVGGPALARDPVLVGDPSQGLYHLVYGLEGAGQPEPAIWHRSSGDLVSWSTATRVSPLGIAASRPSAVVHGGLLRVGYELHVAGLGLAPVDVEVASLDALGGIVRDVVSTTWEAAGAGVALRSASGRLWVEWRDAPLDVSWSRLEAAGGWSVPSVECSDSVAERDYDVPGRIRRDAATLP